MAETGHKLALAEAVALARQQELRGVEPELDLFAEGPKSGQPLPPLQVVNGTRKIGRPVGARNKRTDEAARFYMQQHGDPLSRGVEIAALPILANNGQVLLELSKVLGLSRGDAAKWWLGVYSATLPFVHQRLSTLTVRPQGSPEGEPVSWAFVDDAEVGVVNYVEAEAEIAANENQEPSDEAA